MTTPKLQSKSSITDYLYEVFKGVDTNSRSNSSIKSVKGSTCFNEDARIEKSSTKDTTENPWLP